MTDLSQELKNKIEDLAGCFFTPDDIAIVLQLDLNEFNGIRFEMDDFRIPYQRGKLLKEAEVRKAILKMAVAGSSPAQLMAVEIIDKARLASIAV